MKNNTFMKFYHDMIRENSTNEKIYILGEYMKSLINTKESSHFLNIFNYILNPHKKFYIKKFPTKIDLDLKMLDVDIDIDEELNVIFRFLDSLENREFKKKDILKRISEMCVSFSPSSILILKMSLNKKTDFGVGAKTINKVLKEFKYVNNLIPETSIQLANKYDDKKTYNTEFFYCSPKLDGERCYISKKTNTILSRTNNQFFGFDHIRDILLDVLKKFKLDLIDGELYRHGWKFETIHSVISKRKNLSEEDIEKKMQISFNIFIVFKEEMTRVQEALATMEEIKEYLNSKEEYKRYVTVVQNFEIKNDVNEIRSTTEKFIENGFEGCMLRNPEVPYDFKRSDALLKVKLFKEGDFVILDFKEGEGKYENTLGSVLVRGFVEGHDILAWVPGFDDEYRNYVWRNKEKIKGKIMEVKYFNLTSDNSSLRHPNCIKIKNLFSD